MTPKEEAIALALCRAIKADLDHIRADARECIEIMDRIIAMNEGMLRDMRAGGRVAPGDGPADIP